ncbi:MAG: hypothetical protein KBT15_07735 [Bacteroidales bacterium]|nr:hypothetical protein [Candidatus Minthousia equi]
MVKNTPEYIAQEVFDQYGIEVPLETVITLLESDPYLTPESLYLYVSDLKEDSKESGKVAPIPRGFTVINLAKTESFMIPKASGNYIWAIKDSCDFPQPKGVVDPVFNRIKIHGKTFRVMYTGQATNLYRRLLNNHLNGKIANSTLRRTLATIFGFDFERYMSGKTPKVRITPQEEAFLSKWLRDNCILLFNTYKDIDEMEDKLILSLDPPLNIDKNPNINNGFYVSQLTNIRRIALQKDRHIDKSYSIFHKLFVGKAFEGTFLAEDKATIWCCVITFIILAYFIVTS